MTSQGSSRAALWYTHVPMSAAATQQARAIPLIGEAPPSAAGPLEAHVPLVLPPARELPRLLQTLRFGMRPMSFNLSARRELGDVWQVQLMSRAGQFVVTSHPDHVESLFKAKPDEAPSLTGESPLRPILGPNSVLTSVGARHMRQRKLLLPPFHGEAVERYVKMISEVAEREIASWPIGEPFPLVPRMQAVTLAVIMGGIFGIEGTPERGSVEGRLSSTIRRFTRVAAHPSWQLVELRNLGREEARGALRAMLKVVDRDLFAVIAKRRATDNDEAGDDVLSLLLATRDEDGRPLGDEELRDELLTLVLAGHETTANSLAWTIERLLRTPAAYERLRSAVRGEGGDAEEEVEAAIHEGMRVRPVVPMVVRMVTRPWRLGQYVVPAETPVAVSIVALHHREDVYPEPHAFRPERFLGRKPGTYTWIPFGGGIRRCLGATLAMAEQRVVLRAIIARADLQAPEPAAEQARQRNVTMIPRRGSRVVVLNKLVE